MKIAQSIKLLAIVAAYVATARLGFHAAETADQVSAVWPPTGIALWAALHFGRPAWGAIWLAAFVTNYSTGVGLLASAVIGLGNMFEAIAGAWFMRRFAGTRDALEGLRDVKVLVALAAPVSTIVSALVGVTTLCASGLQPWAEFVTLFWIWWLGDTAGNLLVAPVLMTNRLWRGPLARPRLVEFIVLETLTAGLSAVIFVGPALAFGGVLARHPLEYAVFPLVIWAGLRFTHAGAAIVSGTVSLLAVLGTLNGMGPFGATVGSSLEENVVLLQIFTAVLATSGLILGAATRDRDHAERLHQVDHAVTSILASGSDFDPVAPRFLQRVCETLGWDVGLLWQVNTDRDALECVAAWSDSRFEPFVAGSRRLSIGRGVGLAGRVWMSREPEWVPDVSSGVDVGRLTGVRPHEGLHGHFAFPVVGGDTLGVVELLSRAPANVEPWFSSLMPAIGLRIGQFIERSRVQRRVAESEALNSAIIDAALDCIVTIDAEGRIVEFNPAAVATFGVSRERAIGRDMADLLIPPQHREAHRAGLQRAIATGTGRMLGRRIELAALRADGAEFPIELAITRIGSSSRPAFTAHLRDVSDRKRIEQERTDLLARERQARLEAEQANDTKDQFLAVVSHELRTPLTAVLGWASILRAREFDPARVQQISETLYRNAQTQVQIVNDLLDVSRITRGQLRLNLEPSDVCELARLSLETVRPATIAKNIRLTSKISEAPLQALADPARLQQVLWNLLANAAKFTSPGGYIATAVYQDTSHRVVIEVSDSGVGIAAAQLPRVFERFWQADSSSTRMHGGLGLGLALVRHITELHGGSVEVESEGEGRGSVFRVRLPLFSEAVAEAHTA